MLEDLDPLVARGDRRQLARDPAAGRAAAGVDDAPHRVSALEPERERAVAVGVEADAERLEVAHARRSLAAEDARRALARRAAARGERVGQVAVGRVLRGDRRGDAALRPVARRLRERRARHEHDARALARGRERRVEPGGAGADHGDVGSDGRAARLRHQGRITVPGSVRRSTSTTRARSSTTPARIRRTRRASRRSSRELESRGWLGLERREAPEAERRVGDRGPPGGSTWTRSARRPRPAAGTLDADTIMSPRLLPRGDARRRRRVRDGRRAARRAARRSPSAACARRATTPSARRRWASASSTTSRSRRSTRSSSGAERVLVLDWDVHHGNGTNDIFHSRDDVLFASIHQSPLYPGTGPLSDVGLGAGEGFSLNLPVPPGLRRARRSCRSSSTWSRPAAREFRPRIVLVSAGYDAHRDDPLAQCMLEDGSYGALAACVRELAAELGAPVGVVLEGGYALGALARSVAATIEALGNGDAGARRSSRTRSPRGRPSTSAAGGRSRSSRSRVGSWSLTNAASASGEPGRDVARGLLLRLRLSRVEAARRRAPTRRARASGRSPSRARPRARRRPRPRSRGRARVVSSGVAPATTVYAEVPGGPRGHVGRLVARCRAGCGLLDHDRRLRGLALGVRLDLVERDHDAADRDQRDRRR